MLQKKTLTKNNSKFLVGYATQKTGLLVFELSLDKIIVLK